MSNLEKFPLPKIPPETLSKTEVADVTKIQHWKEIADLHESASEQTTQEARDKQLLALWEAVANLAA
ncbi:MAG: hypothetical protein PHO48_01535 [Candidatus Gracilibacteria bacterium]|jgi:hypothetical protein|nr:hypothetical protein [Candidatus Gracilibacteria bacterium]MDD5178967.1 hypothetical protein [Candidatus Gracilibacteria bacterium]